MLWSYLQSVPVVKRFFSKPAKSSNAEPDSASGTAESTAIYISNQSMDPQLSSPLFNQIPAELRNYIFKLALTVFDDKTRRYKKGAYYYRPDHRFAQKIDTALLLTCRRIYAETSCIPASINEHTSWYRRAPPDVMKNSIARHFRENNPAGLKRCRDLEIVHLFTQQYWLEGQFQQFTKAMNQTNATRLKITLRHTDWWFWENGYALGLEPKQALMSYQRGMPSGPSQAFHHQAWGSQLRNIQKLKEFQLELETVERKRYELDAIVARAPGWQFPLADGNVLVLNETKTTRTGWVGYELGSNQDEREFDQSEDPDDNPEGTVVDTPMTDCDDDDDDDDDENSEDTYQDGLAAESRTAPNASSSTQPIQDQGGTSTNTAPPKPLTAKQRLMRDGVKFIDEHLEPDVQDDSKRMTYYIVTLTWNPRIMTG